MYFKIFLLSLIFSQSCCKSNKEAFCKLSIKASVQAAESFSVLADCKNKDEITADFSSVIYKLNICDASATTASDLGSLICPAVGSFVASTAVKALPARWDCKGGVAADQIASLTTQACKAGLQL
jgi:hypothetical protein